MSELPQPAPGVGAQAKGEGAESRCPPLGELWARVVREEGDLHIPLEDIGDVIVLLGL